MINRRPLRTVYLDGLPPVILTASAFVEVYMPDEKDAWQGEVEEGYAYTSVTIRTRFKEERAPTSGEPSLTITYQSNTEEWNDPTLEFEGLCGCDYTYARRYGILIQYLTDELAPALLEGLEGIDGIDNELEATIQRIRKLTPQGDKYPIDKAADSLRGGESQYDR